MTTTELQPGAPIPGALQAVASPPSVVPAVCKGCGLRQTMPAPAPEAAAAPREIKPGDHVALGLEPAFRVSPPCKGCGHRVLREVIS